VTDHPEAPAARSAVTVRGREVSQAELGLAAEVSRFPSRFGLAIRFNGFLAWRAYTAVRALWRLRRRIGSRR